MRQRWFWLTVVLVTLASLVIGGSVQHFFDQRRADRAFYRAQLTSTEYRFFAAENRQILLPVAQRSAPSFGDLGESIGHDPGLDPGMWRPSPAPALKPDLTLANIPVSGR